MSEMSSTTFPTWVAKKMPAPACTEDGRCKECGGITSHAGTCSWSLMRSGEYWMPMQWATAVSEKMRA